MMRRAGCPAINQDSERWVYDYDEARRVTDADGKSKRQDYDVAGRFNTLEQQEGNRYVKTFNEAGQLSDVSTREATSILCTMMGPSG
ncbi:hypothetical protein [Paenibacillus graminis]|uniref:hypothetical protein n=1 Tax=Paenibacillus graminis TaxID=189425 RepID=UPI000F92F386|nr:hypothetical protein [Paenibacillus graminis]MEC0167082.1 hypothetical protein [Paenibacillus graminis]